MGSGTRHLERHSRRARWLHAAVYLTTLPLLLTGWWLVVGKEGVPSPLARATGLSDARLHIWLGRVLAVAILAGVVLGRRAIPGFFRETFRRDRGDGSWWARWPRAVLTGRFARHEGEFDPGQRVANVVIVAGLVVLVLTGIGLTLVHGGTLFAVLARVHLWTTFVLTPILLGHLLIAVGVLPGYRGVWRAMHLGGRVPLSTARRLWPGWTERAEMETREPASPRDQRASPVE